MGIISEKSKPLIVSFMRKLGVEISRFGNPINLWDKDERFNDMMAQINRYTLVDRKRCFMLYQFAHLVHHVAGDVAEIGVYRGGTAKLLAKVFESRDRIVHLFDTFTGMPATDKNFDRHDEGAFADTSLDRVSSYLSDCKNIRMYKGFFPETARPVEDISFCLVHIDVDIHKSVYDSCVFFYPRMNKNGIMVFDDYGFVSCPGAKKAVDDFFSDKPESPCYLPTGQCVVIKL